MAPGARHVHQLLGALHGADAVGNEALAIRGHLRAAGFDSEIFAGRSTRRSARRRARSRECGRARRAATRLPVPLLAGKPGRPPSRRRRGRPARPRLPQRHAGARSSPAGRPSRRGSRRGPSASSASSRGGAALGLAKSAFSRRDLEAAGFTARARPAVRPRPGAPTRAPSPVFAASTPTAARTCSPSAGSPRTSGSRTCSRAFALLQRGPLPRSRLLLVGDRRPRGRTRTRSRALRARAAPARRRLLRPRRRGRAALPPTASPTSSSRSPSTRATAFRSWRRCSPACRSWPTTRAPWRRRWTAPASSSGTKRPRARGRRDRAPGARSRAAPRPCSPGRSGWRRASARPTTAPWSLGALAPVLEAAP